MKFMSESKWTSR